MALSDGVKSASGKINEYLKGKRLRFFVLVGLILVIVIALTVFLNQKNYTVLYSGMDASETGEVLSLLSEMGVDAKTEGEDTVLVPDGQVDEVRLELAAQGYPSTGINDYSIYSSASGLGTTDSEKQVYYKYQLQANLRATIMLMEKVENAVVNLDLGEESSFVFSENEKPPTASVMLTLRDGEKLNDEEVMAITELVTASLAGLDSEHVRIVDSQMTLYSADGEPGIQSADTHLALQKNVQNQLQDQIVNLLGPVFGEDNVLAEVSVILNFDSRQTHSVEYSAPTSSPEGLVVSMRELVEAITNDADGGADPAGVDANGNASQYLATLEQADNAVYYNVSREVNYEINQTTTQIEEAQGQIEDLSVSVILNSSNIDDYVDEVKNLVATATGAATDRITVEMLPFTGSEAAQAADAAASEEAMRYQEQLMSRQQGAQTLRIVIIAIAALIIMLFLFAIVKMFKPQQVEPAGMGGLDILVDDDGALDESDNGIRDIEIRDKDSNLSVLEEYIGKNPESVANLLRNWLNEE